MPFEIAKQSTVTTLRSNLFFTIGSVTDSMKHGNEYYMELRRDICQKEFNYLSDSAFRLYVMLNELEQRYVKDGATDEKFFRSDKCLAEDLGWSESKVKRAKNELKQTGLISVCYGHYVNEDGVLSEKHFTCYRVR